MNSNNVINNFISYSRENQRLYRYILENTNDNERTLSYLLTREMDIRGRNNLNTQRSRNNTPSRHHTTRYAYPDVSRIPAFVPGAFFSPVTVTPSVDQINSATTVMPYSQLTDEEKSQYLCCSITLSNFTDTTNVMKINSCGHIFSEEGLRRHFTNSVRCPICRHDIREANDIRQEHIQDRLINNIRSRIEQGILDSSINDLTVDICNNTLMVSYSVHSNNSI